MLRHWLTTLFPKSGTVVGGDDPDNPWPSRHHDGNLVMKRDATKDEVLRFKEKIACYGWRDLQAYRVLMPLPHTPDDMPVKGLSDCSPYYNRLHNCVARQDSYDVSWAREYFHTLFTCKWAWGEFTRCVNYRDSQLLKQLVKWDQKQLNQKEKSKQDIGDSCQGYIADLESQLRYAKYMMGRTSAHPLNINFTKWEREEKNTVARLSHMKKRCQKMTHDNNVDALVVAQK